MTGDEAKALRQGLGMSAREVSEELGTTESSIYRWERRRARHVPKLYEKALLWLVNDVAQRRRGIQPDDADEDAG